MSPPLVVLVLVSKPAAKPSCVGLFVIKRTVPDCELAPKSVPCGPGSTSIRSTSVA